MLLTNLPPIHLIWKTPALAGCIQKGCGFDPWLGHIHDAKSRYFSVVSLFPLLLIRPLLCLCKVNKKAYPGMRIKTKTKTQELVFLHKIQLVKQIKGLYSLDYLHISPIAIIQCSLHCFPIFGKLGIISMLHVKNQNVTLCQQDSFPICDHFILVVFVFFS